MIRDYRLRDPKVYPHSFNEEFSSGLCYHILLAGCNYDHLWESVDNHEYTIMAVLSRRKARHVIHGDGFPRSTRGRKWSIEALLLDGQFGDGPSSVGSNVLPDVLSKVQPIEILLQYFHYFLDPKFPSNLTVVRFPNHIGTLAWRNTKVSHVT